jgi:uncharacterized membrane protein
MAAMLALLAACDHRAAAPPPSAADSGSLEALGVLPGYLGSDAASVADDGAHATGNSHSRAGTRQAFRWTAGQPLEPLGFLAGGSFSLAAAISGDGAIIAGTADGGAPGGVHGFRWSAGAGMMQLPGLRDATTCAANAVSADGSVIVGTCLAPMNEAVRWTAAGATGLGRFGTGSNAASSAVAVSGDGRVIGGAGHPVLTGAVVWDASGTPMVVGGLPGDTQGTITALSVDGSVAAGVSVSASGYARAFRWTAATGAVALDSDPGLTATVPAAMSADGTRVVGYGSPGSGPDAAVLWDGSGQLHFVAQLPEVSVPAVQRGWTLTRARGISADGHTIVGEGFDLDGRGIGWRIELP